MPGLVLAISILFLMPSLCVAEDIPSKLEQCVVRILIGGDEKGIKTATGFLVSEKGLIVTADHAVVSNPENTVRPKLVAIHCANGKRKPYSLRLVKRFRENDVSGRDIALLEVVEPPSEPFSYLRIGTSTKAGDPILVAGYPVVFEKVLNCPLLRTGIVAATNVQRFGHRLLVLDLTAVNGFSGSPVVDANTGLVVGVFNGYSLERPESDFSLASVITPSDVIVDADSDTANAVVAP